MDVFNCVVVCGTDVVAQARAAWIGDDGIVAMRVAVPALTTEAQCQWVADAMLTSALTGDQLDPDVAAVLV